MQRQGDFSPEERTFLDAVILNGGKSGLACPMPAELRAASPKLCCGFALGWTCRRNARVRASHTRSRVRRFRRLPGSGGDHAVNRYWPHRIGQKAGASCRYTLTSVQWKPEGSARSSP